MICYYHVTAFQVLSSLVILFHAWKQDFFFQAQLVEEEPALARTTLYIMISLTVKLNCLVTDWVVSSKFTQKYKVLKQFSFVRKILNSIHHAYNIQLCWIESSFCCTLVSDAAAMLISCSTINGSAQQKLYTHKQPEWTPNVHKFCPQHK